MKSSAFFALTAAGVLSSWNLAAADSPTVEERLKKLESLVEGLQKENTELKKELGYDPKAPLAVVKPAGKGPKMSLGGFIQAQAEFGDAPDARYNGIEDRFLLRRARVNVQGYFFEQFDYKLEADFGNSSISESSFARGQLTDVFINWNRYDAANIKVGQYKTPYGWEQIAPDTKILTVERSLPNDRLTDGRQIGGGMAGSFVEKRLSYSAGLFNGTSVNNGFNDNDQFMYVARIQGMPVKTEWNKQAIEWSAGINGLITEDRGSNGPVNITKPGFGFSNNVFQGDRNAWGVDTQFKFGPFDLQAEYLRSHFEPLNNVPASSFDADGWYVTGAYFILPKFLQALVRFESFDPDTSVHGNSTDVWTFGLNYYIKGDDLKLMANYLLGDQAGQKDNQGRLLLRAQVIF